MLATWGCTTFPKPTLSLDFLGATSLDSGITFSRGSQATLFDSTGTLVYAKHNLALQSADFSTTWVTASSAVSTNTVIAPDGTLTADTLTASAATAAHELYQTIGTSVSGFRYTMSLYAKAGTNNFVQLFFGTVGFGSTAFANFDLSNGTLGTVGATATASITPVGDGWYRCAVTATATAAASYFHDISLIPSSTATRNQSWTAAGTENIYIWGAQLNIANMEGGVTSSLTTYYPTTTAAYYAPRFDYNPSTLQPRGLLIEEQRTNSIRNSTGVGAVAGTPGTLPTNWGVGAAAGLTTNVIGTGTEAGVNYVDIQFVGTPTSTAYTLFLESTTQIAALNAQTWSSSLWCKIAAGATTNITSINNNITYRDSGATSLQSSRTAMPLTSTLTRYAHAGTATNASTAFVQSGLWFTVTVGAAIDITLRIGLPQLELGAFATSVIPTTTTALTRSADVASMTGTNFSSWFNAAEGTFVSKAEFTNTVSFNTVYDVNNGTTSNRIRTIQWNDGSNRRLSVIDGNVLQANISGTGGVGVFRFAAAYKANDFAACQDGGAVGTDTAGTVPSVDQMGIGCYGPVSPTFFLNGYIQRIAYYPTRLPNTTLQALTA